MFIDAVRGRAANIGLAEKDNRTGRVRFTKADTKKFLNRILGFHLDIQDAVFNLFMHCHSNVVRELKSTGKMQSKNVDIAGQAKVVSEETMIDLGSRHGKVSYNILQVNRGLAWEAANVKLAEEKDNLTQTGRQNEFEVAFYRRDEELHGARQPALAIFRKRYKYDNEKIKVWKPNVPLQQVEIGIFDRNYTKVKQKDMTAFEKSWRWWYEKTETSCAHFGHCKFNQKSLQLV